MKSNNIIISKDADHLYGFASDLIKYIQSLRSDYEADEDWEQAKEMTDIIKQVKEVDDIGMLEVEISTGIVRTLYPREQFLRTIHGEKLLKKFAEESGIEEKALRSVYLNMIEANFEQDLTEIVKELLFVRELVEED